MNANRAAWLALALCAALPVCTSTAAAQGEPVTKPSTAKKDEAKAKDRLRPTTPVETLCDNVEWTQGGVMLCTGRVKLTSDTLDITGDRMEVRQLGGGEFEAKVLGNPGHLLHRAGRDENGEMQPEMTARGKSLVYNSATGVVDVNGDGRLTRGQDEMTGEAIKYNVAERRVQAAAKAGSQVRIVMQPPPKKTAPASPAPASATPSAPSQGTP